MDSESFTQQLSREAVNELYEFYSGVTQDNCLVRKHMMQFVNEFVQIVIAHALADYDKAHPKKKQMKQVYTNFASLKDNLQEQLANSFSQAMKTYAGQHIDYYCLIKQIATPSSNQPC